MKKLVFAAAAVGVFGGLYLLDRWVCRDIDNGVSRIGRSNDLYLDTIYEQLVFPGTEQY